MNIDNIDINKAGGNNTEEGPELHRLTISRVAEQALISMLDRVNDGFNVGKVNRNNLATWSLIRFSEIISHENIKEIRAAHTDEFAALDMVLRRAKETGKLPPELSAYLHKQMGQDEIPKKKTKKNLQENNINDVIDGDDKKQ